MKNFGNGIARRNELYHTRIADVITKCRTCKQMVNMAFDYREAIPGVARICAENIGTCANDFERGRPEKVGHLIVIPTRKFIELLEIKEYMEMKEFKQRAENSNVTSMVSSEGEGSAEKSKTKTDIDTDSEQVCIESQTQSDDSDF